MSGAGRRVVAVDGPAASGKTTLARRLALHFDLDFLDTGLLYRAVERPFLNWRDRWIPSQFVDATRATTAGQRSPQHA